MKEESTTVHKNHFEEGQKVKEEQVEFDSDKNEEEDNSACDNDDTNSMTDGMRLRRLALWKYFTEKDDNIAACNACNQELRAHKLGSTTNLVRDEIK